MRQWLQIMEKALTFGERRIDRTGVGTLALFGEQLVFDLRDGFPAVTTKQLAFKQMAGELSCFVRGCFNLQDFHDVGCSIWDANATAAYWTPRTPGDVGRIYGVQWRDWRSFVPGGFKSTDQLQQLLQDLTRNPYSRRHLLTTWNPGELDQMCLPPCHVLCQAYVSNLGDLDLRVDMRSVDLFLGLPFDVASYALLQHLIAKDLALSPRSLIFQLGDAHVYLNHQDAVRTVLDREPLALPRLELSPETSTLCFMPEQAKLLNYQHLGKVAAEMAV